MPQLFIALAALVLVGGGYFIFSGDKTPAETTTPTPAPIAQPVPTPVTPEPTTSGTPPVAPVAGKKKYFDGQYIAEGSYVVPNGTTETLTVSLTLKDGIITDADFISTPIEAGSKFNQGNFRKGFKDLVVGKDIDSVNLTVVNGSSLTPKGFMSALATIKTKAQTAS